MTWEGSALKETFLVNWLNQEKALCGRGAWATSCPPTPTPRLCQAFSEWAGTQGGRQADGWCPATDLSGQSLLSSIGHGQGRFPKHRHCPQLSAGAGRCCGDCSEPGGSSGSSWASRAGPLRPPSSLHSGLLPGDGCLGAAPGASWDPRKPLQVGVGDRGWAHAHGDAPLGAAKPVWRGPP